MSNAMSSQGVILRRGDGASPEVFAAVLELQSINGPSGSATVIDVSSLDDNYVQKLIGLLDEGQFTLEGNYLGDNTVHNGLRTDRKNKTLRNFELVLDAASPESGYSFSAYVLAAPISSAVNQQQTVSYTLEISGEVADL
jgi:hypothetical protein